MKESKIYDLYWKFAAERQNIFYKRLAGESNNLTADPILSKYRFTNAYRASDRVSQYLIQHVIYTGSQPPKEIFFRTLLFRFFNRISTWENLSNVLKDTISFANYDFRLYDEILSNLIDSKNKIYSAAYIMPSGIREFGFPRKHQNNLKLLEYMMRDNVPERVAEAKNLKTVFDILKSYPTLGDFLAYQYTIDLAYSNLDCGQESDFVVPGPGALRGITKCFGDTGKLTPSEIIRYVAERQHEEFSIRGIEFKDLFGRPLQLIDCQNLFCEIDKYARAYDPELTVGGRTRIKQKFSLNSQELKMFYPPKWGINNQIPEKYYSPTRPTGIPS
ncbi:hypothetical protein IVG45_17775 [Methylomonas sp. LL1]|uniref:nucleotide kinase domain-containing protein n=1 Tax=Methylomonas sp. LL1 TaxID=2785785 RepID=UPI0018C43402|nr:nucleotide kinase domain-containing protein [Methylomonas sp. LL1]QPK62669.1 hypothetical protein IVG45_17775 [Methylomonas sp. LL1]